MGASWERVLEVAMAEFAGCIPQSWRAATLWIVYEEGRMSCTITDAQRTRRIAPTPWLISLIDDLHSKMVKHGVGWNSGRLALVFDQADEQVDFSVLATGLPDAGQITIAQVRLPEMGARQV